MLTRYHEIACDACEFADHFIGDVIKQAKEHGWIITEDGGHYCGAKCRDLDKDKKEVPV